MIASITRGVMLGETLARVRILMDVRFWMSVLRVMGGVRSISFFSLAVVLVGENRMRRGKGGNRGLKGTTR